jgi:hypothetical protein
MLQSYIAAPKDKPAGILLDDFLMADANEGQDQDAGRDLKIIEEVSS